MSTHYTLEEAQRNASRGRYLVRYEDVAESAHVLAVLRLLWLGNRIAEAKAGRR